MFRVEARGVHSGVVEACLASEVTLGQGRALVGPNRLLAHQHDPPVESFVPKSLGGLGTGQTGTHNHEGLVIGHVGPPCRVDDLAEA